MTDIKNDSVYTNILFLPYQKFLKIIVLLSFIFSITPELFPYFFDLCTVIIFLVLILRFKISYQFLLILAFFSLFLLWKILLDQMGITGFNGFKRPFADIRFFIFVEFSMIYIYYCADFRFLWKIILLFLILNSSLIILGLYDKDIYLKIISIYFNDYYLIPSQGISINEASAINNRLIGFFIQPMFLGGFMISLSFFIFLLWKNSILNLYEIILSQVMILFNLLLSGSTIIYGLIILFSLWWFFNLKFFFKVLTISFILSLLVIIIYLTGINFRDFLLNVDLYLLGSRFGLNSNFQDAFNKIDLNISNILFGFSLNDLNASGKGFGDSGYVYKFVFGGISYNIFYYYFVFLYLKKYFLNNNLILYPIFITGLLVEVGGSYFSTPHFGWLMILFMIVSANKLKIFNPAIFSEKGIG